MKDQINVMNGESTSISDLTVKGFWNRNWGNVESSYRSKIIHLHFQLTIIRHEKFHLANINSTKRTKNHVRKRLQLVTTEDNNLVFFSEECWDNTAGSEG